MSEKINKFKRGEIYWVKFDKKSVGTEIRKPRPAVIVSNDWQNEVSKRVIVLPFSTKTEKVYYPIELLIKTGKIMCDQVKSIDKQRLGNKLGELDPEIMLKVDETLIKLFALQSQFKLWK
ncbi:type II toxin-antitoxin system PemK/MazF family toxin [endosymbiont GvMRE of Glomus versiforme]|uniref:type II toxin-antitoxin system PemK/MazF family toxin n=1 Tax=endosymbiont GvMRE of Glomus versiforme TaxID=2039283 RepID=UPI000ECEC660|nr:type II toxin-antitoxin system PemK/MazF family toxin [endosymbiont GvMRE of Glomus versiforme]RHZ35726.1 mRNA interferase [endosymbiont GvMRE of Glomus versiforme]